MGDKKDPRMETSPVGEAEQEEAGDSLDMLYELADMRRKMLFVQRRPSPLYLCLGDFCDGNP
jgi:hypothetical protein